MGVSTEGIKEMVKDVIEEATASVELRWAAGVDRVSVLIEDQNIQEYHAEVKIGFEVKEEN